MAWEQSQSVIATVATDAEGAKAAAGSSTGCVPGRVMRTNMRALLSCALLTVVVAFSSCGRAREERPPAEVLAELEAQMAATTNAAQHLYVLNKATRIALNAKQLDKAYAYATAALREADSLPRDWNYGNVIHHANIVLGRVALERGDVSAAEARLLEAGKTPGSPQLDSFGPSMSLANALLEQGRAQVVIVYLESCRRFWDRDEQLDAWIQSVRAGERPDFGANLYY